MTRVASLLRVSTLRQARNHREDEETLPVQRDTIRRFVTAHPEWTLVTEYAEEGVSAWSNSSEDRRILQDVIQGARDGQFTILVIFKYDRLSRVSLEYPMLLSQLYRLGVSVWSVADDGSGRELKIEGQMDKLLRFVEGWQAETESYNTSVRVRAKMRQMASQGIWTGGKPPYGFQLLNGGRSKTGGPLSLVVNPTEAGMVREIFRLYLEEDLGSTRIAAWLNRYGYRQRNGKAWQDTTVRDILRNSMAMGRPAYGRTFRNHATGKQTRRKPGSSDITIAPQAVADWVIVPEDVWFRAQEKLDSYNRPQRDGHIRYSKAVSGPLLLTGLLRCRDCGGPVTAGHSMPKHYAKDGTVTQYRYSRYVCRSYTGGKPCTGQHSYSSKRVDAAVLNAVRAVLATIDTHELTQAVRQRVAQHLWRQAQRIQIMKVKENKAARLYQQWTERVNAHLLNPEASLYSEAFLAEQLRWAEKQLMDVRAQQTENERQQVDAADLAQQVDCFLRQAPDWWQHFLAADAVRQKQLLRQLLDKVIISRDGLDLFWRVDLRALTGLAGGTPLEWQDRATWSSGS